MKTLSNSTYFFITVVIALAITAALTKNPQAKKPENIRAKRLYMATPADTGFIQIQVKIPKDSTFVVKDYYRLFDYDRKDTISINQIFKFRGIRKNTAIASQYITWAQVPNTTPIAIHSDTVVRTGTVTNITQSIKTK